MNPENSKQSFKMLIPRNRYGCGFPGPVNSSRLRLFVSISFWSWVFAACLGIRCFASAADGEVLIDFEQAEIGRPAANWVEQGVSFALAHPPRQSRAAGRVMFFPHLATNRKGILCAMATEQIPVQARFPSGASLVRIRFWGSTSCPAQLEAFDPDGRVVDKASVASVPGRSRPEDPIPFFELTVKAGHIAFVQFSGPRSGEFLAADEVRFVPLPASSVKN